MTTWLLLLAIVTHAQYTTKHGSDSLPSPFTFCQCEQQVLNITNIVLGIHQNMGRMATRLRTIKKEIISLLETYPSGEKGKDEEGENEEYEDDEIEYIDT